MVHLVHDCINDVGVGLEERQMAPPPLLLVGTIHTA